MAWESEKQALKQASTEAQLQEAIRAALEGGMPLSEISLYLDWLDFIRWAHPDTDPPEEA